jgi:hypothetical protein
LLPARKIVFTPNLFLPEPWLPSRPPRWDRHRKPTQRW